MHAALILLDLDLALGAGFGVELQPDFCVILVTLDSFQPLSKVETVNRVVSIFETFEAVCMATLAADVGLSH